MFGRKNKTYDVRLTEEQLRLIEKSMTARERKEFRKRQKQAESDRFWDAVIMSELLDD